MGNIIFLGLVSFFCDFSSEMVYPLIPIYLTGALGATPVLVGTIEGIAESTASLLKVFSGYISDKYHRKKPIAFAGYAAGLVYKLALLFSTSWTGILFARVVDRFGKGIRTAPRDVMVADNGEKAHVGRSFGIHKMLDMAGSALGVLCSFLLLTGLGENSYKTVFAISIIPMAAALCMFLFIKEKREPQEAQRRERFWNGMGKLNRPLKLYLAVAFVFTLGNSSNTFLLRKASEVGFSKPPKHLRGLSIVLAMLLVLGVFVGVAVLVIPELINAVALIVQIISEGLEQLASLESNAQFMSSPVGQYLAGINIDWLAIKEQLETFIKNYSGAFVDQAVDATSSAVGGIVTFFIGLTFAIYILAGKEKLKRQGFRLMRAWLPRRLGEVLIHVFSVCNQTFRHFIAGQATEAIILGSLCMVGMAILRIPYAPMIGALVGVTALIPVLGAFVGTIIGAVMILTVDPFKAVGFAIFLLILQQVEGTLIYPKVVGAKINLPAMWVLAAVTVGGNLAGPLGMLLGVPAASAAYALLREATEKREARMAVPKPDAFAQE